MLTEKQLAEMEARCEAATPGPWKIYDGYLWGVWDDERECLYNMNPRPNDSAFIAHARQDVPALLAEVLRLRRLVEDWRTEAWRHVNLYNQWDLMQVNRIKADLAAAKDELRRLRSELEHKA